MLEWNIFNSEDILRNQISPDIITGKYLTIKDKYMNWALGAFIYKIYKKRDTKYDFLYPGINLYEYYYF